MVLAEIYITFEVITFLIFLKGLDEARMIRPTTARLNAE